jgi:Acetyltransferase (GNAT) family
MASSVERATAFGVRQPSGALAGAERRGGNNGVFARPRFTHHGSASLRKARRGRARCEMGCEPMKLLEITGGGRHDGQCVRIAMYIRCPDCHSSYFTDDPDDVAWHAVRHDRFVDGVPVSTCDLGEIVWQDGASRLALVTPNSPMRYQELAEEFAMTAYQEMGHKAAYHAGEALDKRNVHFFLFHADERIAGYARFETVRYARRFTWPEYSVPNGEPLPLCSPTWAVTNLWVIKRHRHRGIAKKAVTRAAVWLGNDMSSVAWQPPFSEQALGFLRRCYPDSFILGT